MSDALLEPTDAVAEMAGPVADPVSGAERRGRRWLMWSFIFCPCHLPVSLAVLAAVFGGTAFGALVSSNTLTVGLVFGAVYAAALAVGFGHLWTARRDAYCPSGTGET